MNLVVVLSKRKKRYAPIASAIVKASMEMGFDIRYNGDDLRGYENVIFFDNRTERLQKVKCDKNANIGWWMCDFRPVKDLAYKKISPKINYIFLCNSELKKEYEENFKISIYYMPQCGYEFEDSSVRERLKNIVFIGSIVHPKYHVNRLEYLMALRKFGLTHIFRDRTSYDMSDIYRRVPVSLSVSLPYHGYTSNRLYNILAAGGFCMALYYPQMEYQFINKKHLVWFNDVKEAKELTRYYLRHKYKRQEIAKNGRKLFYEKHTACHRIQNMTDIMNGKTDKFYGYKE